MWLCTARSSLWSRSSELVGGARSCRRRRRHRSPACLAPRRRCRRHRPSRCSSAAAWSCGLSPAGPGFIQKHRKHVLSHLISPFFLPYFDASLFYTTALPSPTPDTCLSVSLYLSVSVSFGGVGSVDSSTPVPGGKIRLQTTQGHLAG